jgi:IS1 family transposase
MPGWIIDLRKATILLYLTGHAYMSFWVMNELSVDKRAQIIHCLCEGSSIRATARMTDSAINTVVRLLRQAGSASSLYQDRVFRNLKCQRLQCDEIWTFVYAKEKNCPPDQKAKGGGDVWTYIAIDADTKLVPCWFLGNRHATSAYHFLCDLRDRLASRVQLTTDGARSYVVSVPEVLGTDIDYATLVKIYGEDPRSRGEARYSPAKCMGINKAVISGVPEHKHVSTSFVERQNLTMRRFTRLTNAFSKKLENHEHAIALHFMHYNFCRIHQSLRVTPAMEAGVSDHVWSLKEIVQLIDSTSTTLREEIS